MPKLPQSTSAPAVPGLPTAARRRVRALLRRVAAATAPALPEQALNRLAALRAWQSGLAVGLPAYARVLVLAPHPDDESLAAGGTLALLSDAGSAVTIVAATDGEASLASGVGAVALAARRRAELRRAAMVLGVSEVRFLGYRDTGLHTARGELAADLRALLAELRPQLLVLPWAGDAPGDHAALNLALADAGVPADAAVWGGEVWTPVPANRLVDISAAVTRKQAALAAHGTAAGAFDLVAVLGLNRYRSIRGLRGRGHAEAFLACTGAQFPAVVAACLRTIPEQDLADGC